MFSSALRPAHAAWILGQSFDWVDLGGYFRVIVNIRRGRKRAYVAYSLEKPPRLEVAANWLSNYAAKKGIVRPKYVRKFAITKMHAVGMSGDVVRFIAGHTDVHTARYFDVLPQADRESMLCGSPIFSEKYQAENRWGLQV